MMDEIWISMTNGSTYEVANIDFETLEAEISEKRAIGDLLIRLDYFQPDPKGKILIKKGLVLMLDQIVSISLQESLDS